MKESRISLLLTSMFVLGNGLSIGSASAATEVAPSNEVVIESALITEESLINTHQARNRTVAKSLAKELVSHSNTLLLGLSQYQSIYKVHSLPLSSTLAAQLSESERTVVKQKGLPETLQNLYQLRLVDNDYLSVWQAGELPLIAYKPAGDESQWDHIEAFDHNGNSYFLAVDDKPDRPVLVLELDQRSILKAGVQVIRQVFAEAQGQTGSIARIQTELQNTATSLSTTVLKKVRLNDDKEPWILGKAEVYGIVTGINPSRDEPYLDVVDLPYLDEQDKDYYPNQIVIHWQRYRWQAADLILMEQDDNTNFKALAVALLDAATQAMRSIPDPNIQGYAIIPQLTNQILKAMPDHWFANNDDYVDVFYTLFEGQTYSDYFGASGNAKVTLAPLNISSRQE